MKIMVKIIKRDVLTYEWRATFDAFEKWLIVGGIVTYRQHPAPPQPDKDKWFVRKHVSSNAVLLTTIYRQKKEELLTSLEEILNRVYKRVNSLFPIGWEEKCGNRNLALSIIPEKYECTNLSEKGWYYNVDLFL